jgi:DNA-binding protein HU-beta
MAKNMAKSELIQAVASKLGEGYGKKEVVAILDALAEIAHDELKKSGEFTLPGFAKFIVAKKPATPERKGMNPFTKQPITIPAKPESIKVRARPVKAIKDAVS